jgi:hypothetical protein
MQKFCKFRGSFESKSAKPYLGYFAYFKIFLGDQTGFFRFINLFYENKLANIIQNKVKI